MGWAIRKMEQRANKEKEREAHEKKKTNEARLEVRKVGKVKRGGSPDPKGASRQLGLVVERWGV